MTIGFKNSRDCSIGVEIELQIIEPETYNLARKAKDLIRAIHNSHYKTQIKPEITQGMIEINSSVHHSSSQLFEELKEIGLFLSQEGKRFNVHFSGGGAHPFQNWASQKIFPTPRFRRISREYDYIAKQFTVFGLHIHIGCSSDNGAIYLTHMLSRYIPQLIAISASSPFYQGILTGYHSTRVSVCNLFPLSGVIPNVNTWKEFSDYFNEMRSLKIIESMKDFYWDIRPKPEYGTVEVRICDMPLTLDKVIILTAYIQTLASYILDHKSQENFTRLYQIYNFNRFNAARYGLGGHFIDPFTKECRLISDDILNTIQIIEAHSDRLGNTDYLMRLMQLVSTETNDAVVLKKIFNEELSLIKLVEKQTRLWSDSITFHFPPLIG